MNATEFRAIAQQVCEAALSEARMRELMVRLTRDFGAAGTVLFTPEPQTGRALLVAPSACEVEIRAHAARNLPNPWKDRAQELRRPDGAGVCMLGSSILSAAELQRTGYYERTQGNFRLGALVNLVVEGDALPARYPRTHLMLCREVGERDFTHSDVAALSSLHGLFQLAIRAYWDMAQVRQLERAAQSAYDALPSPVLLLGADGKIEFANHAADRELIAGAWITCKFGRLGLAAQSSDQIACAIGKAAAGVPQKLTLCRQRAGASLSACLQLTSLPKDAAFAWRWPDACALALLQVTEVPGRETRVQVLARTHGLSRGEAYVLEKLAAGETPGCIAEARGVRLSTVRTQIRGILDKTGCRRQLDVLRLLDV